MMAKYDETIFDYRLGYVRAGATISGFDFIGEEGAPRILVLGGYTKTADCGSRTVLG